MINPGKPFNIHDYTEIFLRRIWFFIIPFVAIMMATGLYIFLAPKEYKATTLVLVTPQKVPEQLIRSTVTSKIEDRLQSIGQEIMSRTRLEMVIDEFNLYQEEAKSLGRGGIITLMQKKIEVQLPSREREGYFSISYIGKNPKVVAQVTNKLASLFIEENLKLREQQAQGTTEFLAIELRATKSKLEEQEKSLTEFKRKFLGELPEQREANLRVLDTLQTQAQRVNDSLKAAQDRKVIIRKQLSDFEIVFRSASQGQPSSGDMALGTPLSPSIPGSRMNNPYEAQLGQMKNELVEQQAKYTDKHPDILITRKKIADLEAKRDRFEAAAQADAEKEEKAPTGGGSLSLMPPPRRDKRLDPRLNPRYKEIENELLAVDFEIERLKQEDSKVKTQIAQYRERIENTPGREQAMSALNRDYENTREAYATLLRKSQEAQQAENMEARQKGEQFRVIDYARVPEGPFSPDIRKILLIGLFLGLAIGVGAAFFREQMDRSFRDAEDLHVTLGFKVLANIPRIDTKTG